MAAIISVWNSNFLQEIEALRLRLNRYKLLSVDAEFPGFLRDTPRNAPRPVVYDDLKFNVDSTNLIQLGVTLLDDHGNIGPTWEFNVMFDLEKETHVQSSIQFLERSGLDFEKIKQDGIPRNLFLLFFLRTIGRHQDLKWVTFHGMYDLAYVFKLFTGEPLPNTAQEFAWEASSFFDNVFDLKLAAKHCEGLREVEVGLARLSRMLNVKRLGEAHNAGSDSLLTANVYAKLMETYNIPDGRLDGLLYGLEDVRIGRNYKPIISMYEQPFMLMHRRPHPMPHIPEHCHDGNYGSQPCYYVSMLPPPTVVLLLRPCNIMNMELIDT